jgi:hypothetical protein
MKITAGATSGLNRPAGISSAKPRANRFMSCLAVRPGLGFEIRKDWLRKYGKRFFKINETRLKLKVIREKGLKAALDLKKRKESQAA